jgi:pyruvate,water dikinase
VIASLEDAVDRAVFGGKASALATAKRAGLPVPEGFAIGVEVVRRIAGGEVVAEIGERASALGGALAVRSSAVDEDGRAASFAGQHVTCLGVSGDAIAAAIARVHASATSDGARAYRARMGLSPEPAMAIVVQRRVAPECAGVLFTRCPMSRRDERVIEAAWGLGEAVVAGLVTPDRYRLARDGRVLERAAGDKDLALVLRDGKTEEVAIPAERRAALCLDDARLARLHDLALACDRVFGEEPHDLCGRTPLSAPTLPAVGVGLTKLLEKSSGRWRKLERCVT